MDESKCEREEKLINESWKLSYGQVRSQLFENAIKFENRTI